MARLNTTGAWLVIWGARVVDRAATRRAAINKADRDRSLTGHVIVRHARTNERWDRRRGCWFKTVKGRKAA